MLLCMKLAVDTYGYEYSYNKSIVDEEILNAYKWRKLKQDCRMKRLTNKTVLIEEMAQYVVVSNLKNAIY